MKHMTWNEKWDAVKHTHKDTVDGYYAVDGLVEHIKKGNLEKIEEYLSKVTRTLQYVRELNKLYKLYPGPKKREKGAMYRLKLEGKQLTFVLYAPTSVNNEGQLILFLERLVRDARTRTLKHPQHSNVGV